MKVSISLGSREAKVMEEVLEAVPWANAHALARLAVRMGLKALRLEPERIPALLAGQRVRFPPAVAVGAADLGERSR